MLEKNTDVEICIKRKTNKLFNKQSEYIAKQSFIASNFL